MTYRWTISGGKIVDGQGTPSINVKVMTTKTGRQLKATVEISGDLCPSCVRTESKTVPIVK